MSCSSAAPSLGWSPRPGPAKNWRLPTLPSKTLTSTWVRSLFTRQPGPGPSPAPDQHTGFLPREQREERLEEKRAGFLRPQPPDPGWWHATLVTRSAGSNPSYTHHTPIIPPSYTHHTGKCLNTRQGFSLGCTTVWLSGRLQPSQPSYHTFIISYLYFVFSFSPYATNCHNLSLQVKSDSLKDTHLHIMKIYV